MVNSVRRGVVDHVHKGVVEGVCGGVANCVWKGCRGMVDCVSKKYIQGGRQSAQGSAREW